LPGKAVDDFRARLALTNNNRIVVGDVDASDNFGSS
jgi:hypothetical protein